MTGEVSLASEDGETVGARLRRLGRLPWHDAVAIAMEIGDALARAHEQRPPRLHGNLTPETVHLTAGGARLGEFAGNAAAAGWETRADGFASVRYLSPEQIDACAVDARADIYCLGLLLYEMLVGHPPFAGDSARDLINAQCTQAPPPFPPHVAVTVPHGLEPVVRRLLEKPVDARPQTAREAVNLLHAVVVQLPAVAPGSSPASVAAPAQMRASRQNQVGVVIAIGFLGAVAAATAIGYAVSRSAADGSVSRAPTAPPDPRAPAVASPTTSTKRDAVASPKAPTVLTEDLLRSRNRFACGLARLGKPGWCIFMTSGDDEQLRMAANQFKPGAGSVYISGKVRIAPGDVLVVDGYTEIGIPGCCDVPETDGTFEFARTTGTNTWRLQDPMRSKLCKPSICAYDFEIVIE